MHVNVQPALQDAPLSYPSDVAPSRAYGGNSIDDNVKTSAGSPANSLQVPKPNNKNCRPSSSFTSAPTLVALTTGDDRASASYTEPKQHSGTTRSRDRNTTLPPRRLEPRNSWCMYQLWAWASITILAATMFILSKISTIGQMDLGTVADSCDYEKADSTERVFMINVHVARELSFAQAKILDAAWDTVVGQAGRIFHGWIFYRVTIEALTWMSERFSAPYDMQLRLRFDTVSLEAMYTAFLFLVRRGGGKEKKKPARVKGLALWFLVSILYVLFFPTIWGAATGYYQPSAIGYTIPEHGPGVFRQEDLRGCWVVTDIDRLERNNHSGVIAGPPITDSHIPLGFQSWSGPEAPEEFRSLSFYFSTMQNLRDFYGEPRLPPSNHSYDGGSLSTGRSLVLDADGALDWLDMPCNITINELSSDFSECPPAESLFTTILGWQHIIDEQLEAQNLSAIPLEKLHKENKAAGRLEYAERQPRKPFYKDGFGHWNILDARFDLDKEIKDLDTGTVPYNSSLWWRGESVPLSAPFLKFGETSDGSIKCSSQEKSGNDLCICIDGNPIPWETIRELSPSASDNLFCVGGTKYVWGFSSRVAWLGAFFEFLWILSCGAMWTIAGRSSLARHKRPSAGVARSIIDIAPAMQQDLGSDASTYGEKEIMRVLDKCYPVGYILEEQEEYDGAKTVIRMRSISSGLGKRRDVHINGKTLYS